MTARAIEPGLIVSNHGRHFLVETPLGRRLICHSRGKKSQGVVGDRVLWLPSGDEGTIDRFGPNGVAAVVVMGSRAVVRFQSGYLYTYALVMLLGLAAAATWVMTR